MPKAPRDKDSATPTPKKRMTRKATPAAGNGAHAANGNGAGAPSLTAAPEATAASSTVEERIRARAYELYLQRGGIGGSPEEDWLRAQEEIRGRATTA